MGSWWTQLLRGSTLGQSLWSPSLLGSICHLVDPPPGPKPDHTPPRAPAVPSHPPELSVWSMALTCRSIRPQITPFSPTLASIPASKRGNNTEGDGVVSWDEVTSLLQSWIFVVKTTVSNTEPWQRLRMCTRLRQKAARRPGLANL